MGVIILMYSPDHNMCMKSFKSKAQTMFHFVSFVNNHQSRSIRSTVKSLNIVLFKDTLKSERRAGSVGAWFESVTHFDN
jgi:hypothetical protein